MSNRRDVREPSSLIHVQKEKKKHIVNASENLVFFRLTKLQKAALPKRNRGGSVMSLYGSLTSHVWHTSHHARLNGGVRSSKN